MTASKIRFGRSEAASRRRQYVNVVEWNAAAVIGNPQAAFHRRSKVTASTVSLSDNPCNACRVITLAITSAGTLGRPRRDGNRSANISSGNNSPPMGGQERKHTVGLQQMPGNRLRIQQLTLIIRATLHPPIIPKPQDNHTRHAGLIQQTPRAPVRPTQPFCGPADRGGLEPRP